MPDNRDESADKVYCAGDYVETGYYGCTKCGNAVYIDPSGGVLPICEECGGTYYMKA